MFTRKYQVGERVKKIILCASTVAFVLLSFYVIVRATPALAQSQGASTSEVNTGVTILQPTLGLGAGDIRLIIANIIRVALTLVGTILLVIILYAGFLWMTAGGNEEKIATAKKILTNAVIGLAIILSAYMIVTFILRLLGVGVGGSSVVSAPNTQNFSGSGALGGIIKDHYPYRDQIDVPRNTKIIITFKKPILLDSFVDNVNGNDKLGDCTNVGAGMNWKTDCDALKNIDDKHINIVNAETGKSISGANIIADYQPVPGSTSTKVFTIVIRPFDYLGSGDSNVPYFVHLGNAIRLDDSANNNPPAFNKGAVGNDYYQWRFTCSTELDTTPPRVEDVFPGPNRVEVKNSVIQIDFSEAMDPTGLQGLFQANSNAYVIGTNNIALKQSANTTKPSGTFQITNGYKTLEFTPDFPCATNACGGQIYCLPVCDVQNDTCTTRKRGLKDVKQDLYEMLVKAGVPFTTSSFEAIPFSGAMDAAGNGLDSPPLRQIDNATSTLPIFPNWKQPDNFSWVFTIIDDIDLTPPYLNQIFPGLDAEYVTAREPWQMLFSKRLRIEPLYSIGVTEHPTPSERGDNIPLCKVPRVSFETNSQTLATMQHCPFLDGIRQYYFPIISSAIEDAHFNCFYPGLGPGGRPAKSGNHWTAQGSSHLHQSLVCDAANSAECCNVTSTPDSSRALCCNGLVNPELMNISSTSTCLDTLINDSPR